VSESTTTPITEGVRFLNTLFSGVDTCLIRPIETWNESNGKKSSRVDYHGISHWRMGQPADFASSRLQRVEERAARERTNTFFGTCPRFAGNGEYDRAFQIRRINTLWCDIDDTHDLTALSERIKAAGLPEPSVIVDSGNGFHVYWVLESPYLIDDCGDPPPVKTEWIQNGDGKKPHKFYVDGDGEKHYLQTKADEPPLSDKAQYATDILQGIAAAIGGDHTFDLARILRVPGTWNRKNQRNGTKPVPCRMVKCSPELKYPIETFASFAEKSPAKAEREKIAKVKLPKPKKLTPKREDGLNERILLCDTAPQGERSEVDFSLLCWCIEQGIDRQEVWSRVQGVGKFAERGERYFQATWEKAAGRTREKIWEKASRKNTGNTKTKGKAGDTKAAGGEHVILIGVDESRVVDEGIAALVTLNRVYQRAGGLFHIVTTATPPPGITRAMDAPRIVQLPPPRLKEYLADAAIWMNPGSGNSEGGPTHPPKWVVQAIDARGEWASVPPIEGVIEAPVIRSDGSVVQTPGYDEASGLFYQPMIDFPPIPPKPSQDDARKAADDLLEVVEDFPFASPYHRGGWLSAVLTPLARFAFHGPTPLHLIDSNTRGTGKGLLSDTVGLIVQGRSTPRMTAPGTDDEFRKRITAIALAAETLILIDNIEGALGCPALDAALTSTSWSDRILGRSEMATNIPLSVVWMATGNNVQLQADTARRTLHIRLESPEERPEERQGFHHAKLLDWIQRERPRLVTAALTILSGYCAAGRPNMGLKPWGSFDAWSDLVRSAITWAGVDDPGETRTELNATADGEGNALRRLIEGWAAIDEDGRGLTVASVIDAIDWHLKQDTTMPQNYQTVREAIIELVPAKGNQLPAARSVGVKFRKFRHRVVGGRYFDVREDHNGNYWYVRKV